MVRGEVGTSRERRVGDEISAVKEAIEVNACYDPSPHLGHGKRYGVVLARA